VVDQSVALSVRILVADDDPTSRLIVQMALETVGHQCHTVTDGSEAWEAFCSWRPETVVSDWRMPGLSGLELCRAIRGHPTSPYTYFIMVTSQGAIDEILEGMKAGVDDYLVKPLDTDDLQARLIAAARVTSLHRRLAHQQAELEDLNDELIAIARRDPLTGLGNRRALEEDLDLLEARVSRYGHRYCMALNDTHGHQSGDQILRAVATQLTTHARGGDAFYRYGGDEFLCIFPEQSLASGAMAVERMRTGLERLAIPHTDESLGVLTFSAGIAVLDPGHAGSPGDVLKKADLALYRAKQRGRNRVEQAVAQPG
jgi:diguanylate cyclase (GGDEF)-like protein